MNLQGSLSKLTDASLGGSLYPFLSCYSLVVFVTWQWDLLAFMQIHM